MFPWLSVNVAENVQLFPEHLMNAWISDAVLGALTCGTCVWLAKCLRSGTSITIVSSVVCVVHFRFIDLCITVILSDGADSCPRQARCAESSRRSRLPGSGSEATDNNTCLPLWTGAWRGCLLGQHILARETCEEPSGSLRRQSLLRHRACCSLWSTFFSCPLRGALETLQDGFRAL